jgi:homoserine kinase
MFPHMQPAIDAAMEAGAAYAFLSGAGPTICAFVEGRVGDINMLATKERACLKVADAMAAAAKASGIEGSCVVTNPSDVGAHFTAIAPTTGTSSVQVKIGM